MGVPVPAAAPRGIPVVNGSGGTSTARTSMTGGTPTVTSGVNLNAVCADATAFRPTINGADKVVPPGAGPGVRTKRDFRGLSQLIIIQIDALQHFQLQC